MTKQFKSTSGRTTKGKSEQAQLGVGADQKRLVDAARAGDQTAFAELYRLYEPALSRRVRRVLGRAEEVEEVVQETFTKAFSMLNRFDTKRPFAPWLNGIAFRTIGNHLRSRKRRWWQRPSQDLAMLNATDQDALSADDAVAQGQLRALLYRAMEGLPERERIAFALYEIDDMGYTEIGKLVGASPQTVRARVLSARRKVLTTIGKLTGHWAASAVATLERKS